MLQVPKISCIAIVENSCQQIIDNFKVQSYPNKELIIISSGNNDDFNDSIKESLKDLEDVQFISVKLKDIKTIRDLAIEVATGEFICQWENNSISHPHRLISQFKKIDQQNVSGCLFNQHLRYVDGSMYLIEKDLIETIMFRKYVLSACNGFLYTNIISNLKKYGEIVGLNLGYQYINFNQSSSKHLIFEKQEILKQEKLIRETIGLSKLKRPIIVRSLKEIAFTYEEGDYESS